MQVLFVEDDPMNRRVIRDMLTIVGVAMDEANDARTGLQMVQDEQYDVILMDLRMPGMDGLEAIRSIRGRGDAKARTPIIVITADMGSNLRHEAFASGADQVLEKPVAMNVLFDALGQALGGEDHPIS